MILEIRLLNLLCRHPQRWDVPFPASFPADHPPTFGGVSAGGLLSLHWAAGQGILDQM